MREGEGVQRFGGKTGKVLGETRGIGPRGQRPLRKHDVQRSRARKARRGAPGRCGGRGYGRIARGRVLSYASKTRDTEPVVMFGDYGGRSPGKTFPKSVISERLRDFVCGCKSAHVRSVYR